jgi:membrane protease YdiL (CAAX protease family)
VKRGRAWPVFVAYVTAFALCLAASQELVLAVARSRAAGDAARLTAEASRFALSMSGLCAVAAVDAAVLLALALATCRLMDRGAPVAKQLAFETSRATPVGLAAAALGVTGLSLACGAMTDALGVGQGPVMRAIEDALAGSGGPLWLGVAILALAVVPGVAEETFFRGLMQTRLTAALGRWPAIVAAAACFGALHLDLVQGVLAFLVGLLLGWIASRFESVRTAALAHVTNNAVFVVLAHLRLSSAPPGGSLAALCVVGVLVTLASIAVLRSPRSRTLRHGT